MSQVRQPLGPGICTPGAVRVGWPWSWSATVELPAGPLVCIPGPEQPGQVVTLAQDLHRPQLRCSRPKIQSQAAWSELQPPSLPEGVILEREEALWGGVLLPCSDLWARPQAIAGWESLILYLGDTGLP